MNQADDASHRLRWTVYWLLILAAAASSSARIFSVTAAGRDPRTPFLSANDRSRWSMIRALVDHGTFAIDDVIFDPATGKRASGWHTIDLVKHRGWDGREHYYSSKPVLMPTLMAGVYWIAKQGTGASLTNHPFHAGRVTLWLCNIPPLVLMWWLLARMIDRLGRDDWSRCLAMAAATFGTFLTTFSITLNNHVHAAVCVTITVHALLMISERRGSPTALSLQFMLAGLFAALTFANELPALAFLALVAAAALWLDWRNTLVWFAPPVVLVLAAMLGLNYAAHGSLRPPYTHRSDGAIVAEVKVDQEQLRNGDASEMVAAINPQLSAPLSDVATVQQRTQVNEGQDVANRYVLWDESTQQRFALAIEPTIEAVEVRAWDNWYDYDGTYWSAENKRGVDRGEQSYLVYAFHCLVGHHGLFSLTPLWVLAFAGMLLACHSAFRASPDLRVVAAGTLLLSVVCLTFYLLRPLEDRNYGGVCNGLRWMMWFIPLYLLAMLPALSWLSHSRWGRSISLTCLAISIFSASYTPMNPWSHPWLFDYWEYLGWIRY